MTKTTSCIAGTVAVITWFVLYTIAAVSLFKVMWGWFLVPLGVQNITFGHAMGLMALVGWFFAGLAGETTKTPTTTEEILVVVLKPLLVLLFVGLAGLIAHSIM